MSAWERCRKRNWKIRYRVYDKKRIMKTLFDRNFSKRVYYYNAYEFCSAIFALMYSEIIRTVSSMPSLLLLTESS